ncbi:MAG: hypothetical protein M1269_09860 [Chloroflexi bacterium]|nr:hypothetical protein [Chloroflexota bacterium]
MTKKINGIREWNNRIGFHIAELHYSADPEKNPKTGTGRKWLNSAKKGTTPDGWLREYEINWNVAKGDRIFTEFSLENHVRKLDFIPDFPFIRGWDFGYHYPAMVVAQFDKDERLCVLSEFVREDILFDDFLKRSLEFCEKRFGRSAFYYDFCDPAGVQQTHRSRLTDIDVMAKSGIIARYGRSEEPQRTRLMHLLLRETESGAGMLFDSEKCPLLVSGFRGGLVYHPRTPEHAKEIHPYIDLFDALGYLVLGVLDPVTAEPLYPYRGERAQESAERVTREEEAEIEARFPAHADLNTGTY